ncbi:hypothetical protein KC963_01985 [Candidatus Saccharibacteria bacterium]|nr:hypothetical protein [Candidatus Saccharibacteria bacterium]
MPAEEDIGDGVKISSPQTTDPTAFTRLVDPYSVLAQFATAWVVIKFSPDGSDVRIDLPHKEPEAMYELLETLYLLHGWKGVDAVYERVQRSLIAAVVNVLRLPIDELNAITLLIPSSEPLYIPPDHIDLLAQAIANLIVLAKTRRWPGVIAGLKAVTPVNGLFSSDTPYACTQTEAAADPEVAARLYADVLVSLQLARRQIVARVMKALQRAEVEAQRLIMETLTDTRGTIIRETLRYFDFKGKDGALAALSSLKSFAVAVKDNSREANQSDLGQQPKALQTVLKQITPFAREVLKLRKLRKGGPSTVRFIDSELGPKLATFAREIGRHAQEFPILSQIKVEDVEKASNAGHHRLGEILFPILRRAYTANRSMRARINRFDNIVESISSARLPEQALMVSVGALKNRNSAWSYPKYVERAISRIVGMGDDITRKALNDVYVELQTQSGSVAKEMAQAAGEMMVLGATSRFAARFVPVLNVSLSAWHISTAIQEFKDQHDEFYCSLDPRDALVQAAPSAAGLAVDIASEAAFAFI